MSVTAEKESALMLFGFIFLVGCTVLVIQNNSNSNPTWVTIGWLAFSLGLVAFLGVYFWEKIQEKICSARTSIKNMPLYDSPVGLREKRFQIEVL